jgi:hypothetical protein
MKQMTVVFRTVLLIAVLVSLSACNGGVFYDPGYPGTAGMGGGFGDDDGFSWNDDDDNGGGGSSGGGGGKPTGLDYTASYGDAVAKVDEIIAYCKDNPGPVNDNVKYLAESLKITALKNLSEKSWSGAAKVTIDSINSFIDQLQ